MTELENKQTFNQKVKGQLAKILMVVGLGTCGIIATVGNKVEHYTPKAQSSEYTFLVYMDGSDLESQYGAANDDLKEMQESLNKVDATGEKYRIVVEAGGAKTWQFEPMQEKEYGRFFITGKEISKVTELPKRDMGRADTLTDFVNFATQSYPAKHYGLIFWNHGSGSIKGFGSDENFKHSTLQLSEIKHGLDTTDFKQKFDFVAMDACLLGNLELVSTLENKANYLIASEDLEPQEGFDYHWLENLSSIDATDNGKLIGDSILSSYQNFYASRKQNVTLSLIDLTDYQQFKQTFDECLQSLATSETIESTFDQMGVIRNQMLAFGRQGENQLSNQVDFLDLFLKLTENKILNKQKYSQLEAQFQKLVVNKVALGYPIAPSGLSIYLPNDGNSVKKDLSIYESIDFDDSYKSLVSIYGNYLTKKSNITVSSTPNKVDGKIQMSFELSDLDKIADAYHSIYEVDSKNRTYLLSSDSDVVLDNEGYLVANLENTFWGLKGEKLCLIEQTKDTEQVSYLAPILYKKQTNQWQECLMTIVFTKKHQVIIQTIQPFDLSKQEYQLEEGDSLIPLYPLYPQSSPTETEQDATQNDVQSINFGELNKKIKNQIFGQEYLLGNLITMDSFEYGDNQLEQIEVKPNEHLKHGFIIRDTNLNLSYTKLIES